MNHVLTVLTLQGASLAWVTAASASVTRHKEKLFQKKLFWSTTTMSESQEPLCLRRPCGTCPFNRLSTLNMLWYVDTLAKCHASAYWPNTQGSPLRVVFPCFRITASAPIYHQVGYVCLFVCWNKTRKIICRLLWWGGKYTVTVTVNVMGREVNPLGMVTHGQRHKPRAYHDSGYLSTNNYWK
jgi:hypothetical protein